jgi:hypothetical protein
MVDSSFGDAGHLAGMDPHHSQQSAGDGYAIARNVPETKEVGRGYIMKNWVAEIDNLTAAFMSDFGELSADELNWKVNSDTWSIAQNIEHLIIINESYVPIIESAQSSTLKLPFISKFGFMVNMLGNAILKSSGPDRRKKIKTFPVWTPSQSDIPGDILKRFQSQQERLKAQIQDSVKLIENGAVIFSPANNMIVYKLETAFDIIVAHEKRHLEQSREVLNEIKS